jgi:hypothetical protein
MKMTKKLRIVIEVEGGSEDATITIDAAKAVVRGCAKAIERGDEIATQFYRAMLKGFAMATGACQDRNHVDPKDILERWEAGCAEEEKETVH